MYGGNFGHTRFGLATQGSLDIPIAASFSDSLKSMAGFGVTLIVTESLFDSLGESIRLTATTPISFGAGDTLKANVEAIGGVVIETKLLDKLSSKSVAIKNIETDHELKDGLLGRSYLGKDMHLVNNPVELMDSLSGTLSAVKDLPVVELLSDILNCDVSTVILENDIFLLNVTVPAGGLLEINSDTFEVFLNGENILQLQDGEWVFLSRDVTAIQVDSGTGGALTGQVLYQERYL